MFRYKLLDDHLYDQDGHSYVSIFLSIFMDVLMIPVDCAQRQTDHGIADVGTRVFRTASPGSP